MSKNQIKLTNLESKDYVHGLFNGAFQLSQFLNSDNNILFITGLSGSGKTTLAREIERKMNVDGGIVELDNFEHGITSNCPIVWEYIEANPRLRKHFETHWIREFDKTFSREFSKFFYWLLDRLRGDKKSYIVEGIQMMRFLPSQWMLVDDAVVVKMTDAKTSHTRAMNDKSRESFIKEFKPTTLVTLERSIEMQKNRDKWVKDHMKFVSKNQKLPNVKGVNVALNEEDILNEAAKKAPWDPNFFPCYTPKEMLSLGVFEGKYLNDDKDEYPADWYKGAKTVKLGEDADPSLNKYGIKSRQSLQEWKKNGWINKQDPKGWFQWYCRYYQGRRSNDDKRQINRWRSFVARHQGQINNGCKLDDDKCRPKQRQGLLQWAWDSSKKFDDPEIIKANLKKMGFVETEKKDAINEAVLSKVANVMVVKHTDFLTKRPAVLAANRLAVKNNLEKRITNAKSPADIDKVLKIIESNIKNINRLKHNKTHTGNMIPYVDRAIKTKIIDATLNDMEALRKKALAKKNKADKRNLNEVVLKDFADNVIYDKKSIRRSNLIDWKATKDLFDKYVGGTDKQRFSFVKMVFESEILNLDADGKKINDLIAKRIRQLGMWLKSLKTNIREFIDKGRSLIVEIQEQLRTFFYDDLIKIWGD